MLRFNSIFKLLKTNLLLFVFLASNHKLPLYFKDEGK